jgi:hypothetical protein
MLPFDPQPKAQASALSISNVGDACAFGYESNARCRETPASSEPVSEALLDSSAVRDARYQGPFISFPVQDDEHLLTVVRYVERNPVRANLIAKAEE